MISGSREREKIVILTESFRPRGESVFKHNFRHKNRKER